MIHNLGNLTLPMVPLPLRTESKISIKEGLESAAKNAQTNADKTAAAE
jgi:hypothetical protein